jgi:hypothetical protein
MPSPSPERTLLYPTCGARLRRRPGHCARIVKAPGARCPVHSGGELSPEGRAIISAAAKMRHAKQRAAARRNELRRYPQGRRKKWLIARPWRFRLSPEDEARVLAHMAEYDRRVRGGEPRPPWQATTSTSVVAKDLESCERALILAMNRPDPPPLKTAEEVYADVRAVEAIVGDAGSDARLERLRWEIERFRRSQMERHPQPAAKAAAKHQVGRTAGELRASRPLRADEPLTGRPHVTSSPPSPPAAAAPPDSFREAVAPHDAVERELAAELARAMRQISTLPLAESARARLNQALANSHGVAERLQVLKRWFARMERAYAMTEAMVGPYMDRAEARAELPVNEWRPLSIVPRAHR